MPVTFEKDKDGRVRPRGSWTDSATPGAPKRKPSGGGFNPLAEIQRQLKRGVKAADNAIKYEQKRYAQDPGKRFSEVTGRLTNSARYELKQLSTPGGAVRSLGRATRAFSASGGNPALMLLTPKVKPLAVSAVADIVRNGVEIGQTATGRAKGDYTRNPIGKWADKEETKAYAEYGWTPRDEQQGLTRLGTELGIGAVQAVAAYYTGVGAVGLGSKLPLVGGTIGRGGAAFARLLNPTNAKTFLGGLTRAAAAGGIEEGISTPFQDNTGGGVVSLVNAVLGTEFDDPVKPEMDRVEAMQTSLPGNIAAGVAVPLALGGLVGGAFKGIARARRAQAEVRPVAEARQALAEGKILQQDPVTGAQDFTPEVLEQPKPAAPEAPPTNFKEALEQAKAKTAAAPTTTEAPAPVGTPDPWETPAAEAPTIPEGAATGAEPDPWQTDQAKPLEAPEPEAEPFDLSRYDPETTFEADVVLSQLRELSHEQLQELYQLDPAESLTMNLERVLSSRTPTELGEQVNWDNVSAPKENLSQRWLTEKYPTLLAAADPEGLRAMFRNSPELAAMARSLTGRSLDELTKQDMVMVLLQHPERALLPGRLENAFENVWDLSVKPDEYQFKQNVDERGVQANNSLSGVKTWDPDAEGTLEVRRVPDTGDLDMVNGHNRLALARELGIPSVPVKYMRTETAAQAREMGAISNISSGGGTVWDAAKFLRENPSLDTMAKLKADGKPGKSGLWRDGLALSKLPDDLFKAAQDGVIESKYAVLIGNSGLDEAKMRTLFRKATTSPSVDSMLAYIEIARVAGTGEVSQGALFGGGAEDLTDQLADLYSDLQRSIADDKLLFGRVSRGAEKLRTMTESTVDVAGSIQISEGAKQAQRFVKDNWVSYPDLAKAMQDGARAIKNGASKASVVREIKQAIPGMLDDAMSGGGGGKALTFEEGAAQGDLLASPAEGEGLATGNQVASPEAEGTPLFDVPSEAQAELTPDAPGTPQFKAAPALIERWEGWTAERQDQVAMQSNKALLGEKALANRQKKAEEVQARQAKTQEYLAELPGSNDPRELSQADFDAKWGTDESTHPTIPSNQEWKKSVGVLEEHQAAIEYLDWYDNRISKRAPEPGQQSAMELELIRRGIANGELRPPDMPIPEIDGPQGVDIPGAMGELASGKPGELLAHASDEELRLREAQARQDAEVEAAMLEAEREATGYFEAPTEELIPEILNEMPPIESVSIADSLRALTEAMIESDRRLYRGVGELMDKTKAALDKLGDEAQPALPEAGSMAADSWASAQARAKELDIPEDAMRPTTTVALAKGMGQTLKEWGIAKDLGEGQAMAGRMGVFMQPSKLGDFDRADLGAFVKYAEPMTHPGNLAIQEKLRKFYAGDAALPATRKPGTLPGAAPAGPPAFTLPQELKRSAPRYSSTKLEFESDLDKAAYIIGRDSITGKRSKAAEKFEKALVDAGISIQSARNHGRNVHREVRRLAGGGAAAPESVTIPAQSWDLPDSGRAPAPRLSIDNFKHRDPTLEEAQLAHKLPAGHPYRTDYIKWTLRQRFDKEDARLYGDAWADFKIDDTVLTLLAEQSVGLQDAFREGVRVSGIDPERFRVVPVIDVGRMFGEDAARESHRAWIKGHAYEELLDHAPTDPVTSRMVGGQSTAGVQVPDLPGYDPVLRDTIHVSLSLAMDRLAFLRKADWVKAAGESLGTIGSKIRRTAYHEAFHRLQDKALTVEEQALLDTPESRGRMEAILKQGNGLWSESMLTPEGWKELQAESFAVWAQMRKAARDAASPVDRVYAKLNDLVKTVQRRIRTLQGKNAAQDLFDVWEMAYSGELGKRSPSDLSRLAKQMDPDLMSVMPNLEKTMLSQIMARKAEAEAWRQKITDDLNNGGCT